MALSADVLRARLVAAGLGQHADVLLALAEPSLRLRPQPALGQQLQVGATKLGGRPDLPASWPWPRRRRVPLSFIAQIDLAAIAHHAPAQRALPPAGLLLFFYDALKQPWGFDPRDGDAWQVGFIAPGTPLARTDFPAGLPGAGRFQEVGLAAEPQLTYAHWESLAFERLELLPDQQDAYCEVLMGGHPGEVTHRLLGHPDPIQADMQLECQLASNGIDDGAVTGQPDLYDAALAGATDWQLLLQVDSDRRSGMMWGDAGRIYYWMRAQDLAARRFDRAWLVLQCG